MNTDYLTNKTSIKRVKISEIGLDPVVRDFALNCILTLSFRIQVAYQPSFDHESIISPDAMRMLLIMHPIIVYRDAGGIYCVAGLRTYFLAQMILPSDEKIPVTVLDSAPACAEIYAHADLYLGQLFLCVKSIRDIGIIFSCLPRDLITQLTPSLTSKALFAKALEYSKSTVFTKKCAGSAT